MFLARALLSSGTNTSTKSAPAARQASRSSFVLYAQPPDSAKPKKHRHWPSHHGGLIVPAGANAQFEQFADPDPRFVVPLDRKAEFLFDRFHISKQFVVRKSRFESGKTPLRELRKNTFEIDPGFRAGRHCCQPDVHGLTARHDMRYIAPVGVFLDHQRADFGGRCDKRGAEPNRRVLPGRSFVVGDDGKFIISREPVIMNCPVSAMRPFRSSLSSVRVVGPSKSNPPDVLSPTRRSVSEGDNGRAGPERLEPSENSAAAWQAGA